MIFEISHSVFLIVDGIEKIEVITTGPTKMPFQ